MNRVVALCLLALLLHAGVTAAHEQAARAPALVTPSTVAARGLPIRVDTLDGYVGLGDQRQLYGMYIYAVARAKLAGRSTYLVTLNYAGGGAFQSDTLALDATTLEPLWRRFHGNTDSVVVAFTNRRAKGVVLRNGGGSIIRFAIDYQLAPSAFGGNLYRWFIGQLPLKTGYAAMFTTFSTMKNSVDTTTITVARSESIQVGKRTVDAWLIRTNLGGLRWIDKKTGLIVQEHDSAAFSGQGAWHVKRLPASASATSARGF